MTAWVTERYASRALAMWRSLAFQGAAEMSNHRVIRARAPKGVGIHEPPQPVLG
jgi:hypothetical protein